MDLPPLEHPLLLNGNFLRTKLPCMLFAAGVAIAACGTGETQYEHVSVNGWAITQDALIKEKQWVKKTHRSSLPKNQELRNVDDYPEKTGSTCYAYDDNFNCTFSVPNYGTFYDYEIREPVVAIDCHQEPVFSEYSSSNVSSDKACWEQVGAGQWLERQPPDYVVRIYISNGDKSHTCNTAVSKTMYYRTGRERSGLQAIEQGRCNITSLTYPNQNQ